MEIVTKVEPYAPLDNYPVEYKRVLYTREDLESIPLEPSKRVIRLYDDNPYEKAVDWNGRLAQGFKRYQQLYKNLGAKHVGLTIDASGYHLKFCGADNLDISKAVAKRIQPKRLDAYVEVLIPYATPQKPKHWSRTWHGLWNQVRGYL